MDILYGIDVMDKDGFPSKIYLNAEQMRDISDNYFIQNGFENARTIVKHAAEKHRISEEEQKEMMRSLLEDDLLYQNAIKSKRKKNPDFLEPEYHG